MNVYSRTGSPRTAGHFREMFMTHHSMLPFTVALAFACACGSTELVAPSEGNQAPAEGKAEARPTATDARATQSRIHADGDFGPRPSDKPVQQIPRLRAAPASEL